MGVTKPETAHASIESREDLEWPVEIEVKVLGVSHEQFSEKFLEAGMEFSPSNTIKTTWYDRKFLPKGVTARVRVQVEKDGTETFKWNIKRDIPEETDNTKLEISKAKYEYEAEAASWDDAEEALRQGLIKFFPEQEEVKLEKTDTVVKERVSFHCGAEACTVGECAGLQFDFDKVISSNGEILPTDHPLFILEIEALTDVRSRADREKGIRACAEKLGIAIYAEDSKRSTRSLIRERLGRK